MLDLFGTLVDAPTATDRRVAAERLAAAAGAQTDEVESYLIESWQRRHDGTLPTVEAVAADLIDAVHGAPSAAGQIAGELTDLGRERIVRVDASVIGVLALLRSAGLRIGILTDAAPEIAAAWQARPLAPTVDAVVFSSTFGATKPNAGLYQHLLAALRASAPEALYCGDGGGSELDGAAALGMRVVRVRRRGPRDALAFGQGQWNGPVIDSVEQLPVFLGLGLETTTG